jgi:flagellar export protein FliJ
VSDQPFVFRLERLRWLRKLDERGAQEQLAESMSSCSEGERELRSAEAAVEGARGAARAASGAPESSGQDLVGASIYLEQVARQRAAAERLLAEREAEVDDRRRELSAAASRRQALDRLRGQRRAEHDRAQLLAEGARLDEMALAAHRRGGAAA